MIVYLDFSTSVFGVGIFEHSVIKCLRLDRLDDNINLQTESYLLADLIFSLFVCLFELMLNISVNSNGHVGTFPPSYGTFTKTQDVVTSKNIQIHVFVTYQFCHLYKMFINHICMYASVVILIVLCLGV